MNAPRLLFLTVTAMAVIPAAFLRAQGAATAPAAASFLEYRTIVPARWVAAMPSSTVRLAEYRVPATNGAIPVEIVVYFFGPGQGGSSQANLDRWKSQFSKPSGGAVAETVRRDTTGAFPLPIAKCSGTSARGTLFFQCVGPVAALDAQRAVYLQFVRGGGASWR